MTQKVDEEAGGGESLNRRQGQAFAEGFSFSGYERDHLYLNLGTKAFMDIDGMSGVDSITDGRGAVYADFDNDGDMDIFVRAMHGPAHLLYRNNVGQENRSVRIALQGTASGRDAFGAVVRMKTPAGILTKIKSGGSGFLSQSDPRLLFGLGRAEAAEWIEVVWPSGTKQRFGSLPAGTSWLIVEGGAQPSEVRETRFKLPEPPTEEETRWSAVTLRRGEPLPPSPLVSLTGEKTTLDRITRIGRPVLVNLWATWCLPCREEMPELERLHREAGERGVSVIGISLDDETTRDRVGPFLREHGVTYPVYLADPSIVETLFRGGDAMVPFSILVGPDGKAMTIFPGWSESEKARLRDLARPSGGG